MTTLYRFYTERRPNLAELTSRYFDGFTLIDATGYWQGIPEDSTIIEILGDDSARTHASIRALAEYIRRTNNQQTVLVSEQTVTTVTVTAEGSYAA